MADQIPADILYQIFLLCLPQHTPLYPQPLQPLLTTVEVLRPQHKAPLPRALQPPLVFGRVCRHWRGVSSSFGRLWAQLDVPIRTRDLQPTIEMMLEWLPKSATYPVTLSIAFCAPRVDDLQSLLKVITPHANRLEHLELYAPKSIAQSFIKALLHSSKLRLLRTLHLITCPVNREPRLKPIELRILPQFVSLSVRGAFKIKPMNFSPQTNLRVLCLDMMLSVAELLDYLLMCPSVEELSLFFDPVGINPSESEFRALVAEDGEVEGRAVAFPRIRKFHVGLNFLRTTKALRSLSFPSLRYLSCGPTYSNDGYDLLHAGWRDLSSMLKRSNADLISFHVEGSNVLPSEELVRCLELSPNLKYLSGNPSFWTVEVWDSLIRPRLSSASDTPGHLVPLLEEITVHGFYNQDQLLRCLHTITSCRRKLARVTFECRECDKDVVLNNRRVQLMMSAGLDVQFRVKVDE